MPYGAQRISHYLSEHDITCSTDGFSQYDAHQVLKNQIYVGSSTTAMWMIRIDPRSGDHRPVEICGHCGNKLILSTSDTRQLMPNGSIERPTRAKYKCHFNVQHPSQSDGQSGYCVKVMDRAICHQLSKLKTATARPLSASPHISP